MAAEWRREAPRSRLTVIFDDNRGLGDMRTQRTMAVEIDSRFAYAHTILSPMFRLSIAADISAYPTMTA